MASNVVIYTTDYCPYCRAAKDLLKAKGVVYKEVDLTHQDSLREKISEKSGMQTVPQIFADEKLIGGYDDLVSFYKSGKSL